MPQVQRVTDFTHKNEHFARKYVFVDEGLCSCLNDAGCT